MLNEVSSGSRLTNVTPVLLGGRSSKRVGACGGVCLHPAIRSPPAITPWRVTRAAWRAEAVTRHAKRATRHESCALTGAATTVYGLRPITGGTDAVAHVRTSAFARAPRHHGRGLCA